MADHIQIGDISPRIQYTGDGSQTAFTYPFPIFVEADLEAYEDDALKTVSTDYSVSGAGDSAGGTVTFTSAPATGVVVTLRRNKIIERTSDFQESGEFRARVINDELDILTALVQQLDEQSGRSLTLGPTDTSSQTELPGQSDRSGKFLAFDTNGDPIASAGSIDTLAVSTYIATLIDDADAATAQATLGLVPGTDVLSPTGDGSNLTGIATGATDGEKANIALNSFRISVNGGLTVQNMVDGVVDEFEDETGVDTGTSTNEIYDAAGNFYSNPYQSAVIAQATGTQIGDLTSNSGLASTWDANLAQAIASSAASTTLTPPSGYVGKDWGVSVTKTIARYKVWSPTDGFTTVAGASTITLRLYGSNTAPTSPTNGTLLHTDSFANSAATIIKDYSTGITTTTAYRYHWVTISCSTGTMERVAICEINLYEQTAPLNMTLQSNAGTALAQPADVFQVLWHEAVDSVSLNTDLKAWASIDGGTTWVQAILSLAASLSGNEQILTGTADVSGQTGTSIKWKIETLNNKEQRLHGVSEQWS